MRIIFPTLLAVVPVTAAFAEHFEVDKAKSVFAVVTHRGGIAAGMAHNHFVYPAAYKVEVTRTGSGVEGAHFKLSFPVRELTPDVPEVQKAWYPRIQAMGILDEPFSTLSEENRKKVRKSMLSPEQLDVEKYPEIAAEVGKIEPKASRRGNVDFTHAVALRFTVHGKTVERPIPARIEFTDDTLKVEASERYRFTEFGIEPYKAFLGAVETKDEFDLYVNLTARRVPE